MPRSAGAWKTSIFHSRSFRGKARSTQSVSRKAENTTLSARIPCRCSGLSSRLENRTISISSRRDNARNSSLVYRTRPRTSGLERISALNPTRILRSCVTFRDWDAEEPVLIGMRRASPSAHQAHETIPAAKALESFGHRQARGEAEFRPDLRVHERLRIGVKKRDAQFRSDRWHLPA